MDRQHLINRQKSLFINGQWSESSIDRRIKVIDPSRAQVFASIPAAGAADVERAVQAAVDAYHDWRMCSGEMRAKYLRRFAVGLHQRNDELVELQMLNNGKPKGEAQTDVNDAIATFEYYAHMAEQLDNRQGEKVAMPDESFTGKTRYEPIGPVGLIVPWNFPLVTSAWKIAPAMAAGCTVVMKNSEITLLIELVYGDIAQQAELPSGVLNLVTGEADAGIALTGDPRLRKISFTGSNMVGAKVMQAVSERCLPLSLELGGKSPIVVFADADKDLAVECILAGIFYNCGQMCSATARLIIDEKIAHEVIDNLVTRAKRLKTGSPFETDVDMGPITLSSQYEKILGFFERASNDGLDCLTGGGLQRKGDGYFVEPTIYMDVPRRHPIWREEIFGPVLAINTFSEKSQAFELANDSEFALVATIISEDVEKAESAAARIDGSHVWINSPQVIFPNSAWGGFRASGIGRELGPWGLSSYQGVKHLTIQN